MLKSVLRSGTTGLVILSMTLPQLAMAQDAKLPAALSDLPGDAALPRKDGVVQLCMLQDPAPCVMMNGKIAKNAAQAERGSGANNPRAALIGEAFRSADAAALKAPIPADAPKAPADATADKATDKAAPDAATTAMTDAEAAKAKAREERIAKRRAERQAAAKAEREAAGRDVNGETVTAKDDTGLTEETAKAEAKTQAEAQEQASSVEAATAPENDTDGKVKTEVVKEGDQRKPDQEFSKSQGDEKKKEESKRRGLTPVETIALLGVGALVVGALLDNGDEVVQTAPDRAVVRRPDGSSYVLKDDDTLLRQPGNTVQTRQYDDGSTVSTVTRADGSKVQTVRDATGQVLRRVRIAPDGSRTVLFDDTRAVEPVDVSRLPRKRAETVDVTRTTDLDAAMRRQLAQGVDRTFSLGQIRRVRAVRELVPEIDVNAITFQTGSAVIPASQAEKLTDLGKAMQRLVRRNPGEMFLIEGHTDAVGSAASNLTLSDRRAESLAAALTDYFGIPPENMVVQGYGESYLKVPSLGDERRNRRVAVRDITPLLTASAR